MKKLLSYLFCLSLLVVSCDLTEPQVPDNRVTNGKLGIIDFFFNTRIIGLPDDRIKRTSLRIAYTSDSLDHNLFFTSTNVSDAVSKYRMYLPEGIYYYKATIICLCQGDSCIFSGFSGQNGSKATGGKVVVIKDQVTQVSTQFY